MKQNVYDAIVHALWLDGVTVDAKVDARIQNAERLAIVFMQMKAEIRLSGITVQIVWDGGLKAVFSDGDERDSASVIYWFVSEYETFSKQLKARKRAKADSIRRAKKAKRQLRDMIIESVW